MPLIWFKTGIDTTCSPAGSAPAPSSPTPVCWLAPVSVRPEGLSVDLMGSVSGRINLFVHILFGGQPPISQYVTLSPKHSSAHDWSPNCIMQLLPTQSLGWR